MKLKFIKRFLNRSGLSVLISLLALTIGISPVQANAGASVTSTIEIDGTIPAALASGSEVIVLGVPSITNISQGDPITFPILSAEPAAGGSFSIAIPASTVNGLNPQSLTQNVIVELSSGIGSTEQMATVSSQGTVSNMNNSNAVSSHLVGPGAHSTSEVVKLARFPMVRRNITTSPGATIDSAETARNVVQSPNGCDGTLIAKSEHSSRIGELHVANTSGVTASYDYKNGATSQFDVGLSYDNGSTWNVAGGVQVSNTDSTGASVSEGPGFLQYIDSDFMYGEFSVQQSLFCLPSTFTEPYAAIGDAFPGPNQPSPNPYGNCLADPNGFAHIPVDGSYTTGNQSAEKYSSAATLFGFSFGDVTGYSTSVEITYHNQSAADTYVCGSNIPALSPILYNSPA